VLRLGNRWDLAFHNALKRDAKGEVVEFDIEPQLVEDFGTQMSEAVKKHMKSGQPLRHRRRAGCPPICPHDRGTHVPDASGAVASGNRPRC
jgi:hypothetical protein